MAQPIHLRASSGLLNSLLQGLVVICGQETISLAESTDSFFNIMKLEVSKTSLTFSLKDSWTSTHPD
jgi:hypothetical protein